MKRTTGKSLGIVFLIASSVNTMNASRWSSNYYSSEPRPENIVLGVCGTIAAGLGIYALGFYMEWWGAPTNQELVDQARNCLARAGDERALCAIALQARSGQSGEHILYAVAMHRRTTGSQTCSWSLHNIETELRSVREKIGRRVSDLSRGGCPHDHHIINEFNAVIREIDRVLPDITFAGEYLSQHSSYFQLFKHEDSTIEKYRRELHLLEQYAHNHYELSRQLRSCLTAKLTGAFALVEAAISLRSDVSWLEGVIRDCGSKYPVRSECARGLVYNIKRMLEIIVSEPDYAPMVAHYEAAQREKERLRIEQERLANERRIARAKEQEVYAREREARAREEHNRLKAQENYLKAQELYDNRAQQYYNR